MNGRYHITLDSQLGAREGTLTLAEHDGRVEGVLSLLGFDNPVHGAREGATLRLEHGLRTLVRELPCRSVIEMRDGRLSGTVQTGNARMTLRGYDEQTEKEETACRT